MFCCSWDLLRKMGAFYSISLDDQNWIRNISALLQFFNWFPDRRKHKCARWKTRRRESRLQTDALSSFESSVLIHLTYPKGMSCVGSWITNCLEKPEWSPDMDVLKLSEDRHGWEVTGAWWHSFGQKTQRDGPRLSVQCLPALVSRLPCCLQALCDKHIKGLLSPHSTTALWLTLVSVLKIQTSLKKTTVFPNWSYIPRKVLSHIILEVNIV